MQLFIAEKPDLAKAIVDGLGGGSRKDGYYDCGDSYVTWCYGHMLQLLDPEDYDPRFGKWNMDDLPIYHIPWKKKPSNDKKDQLKIITTLLKQAKSVVHAGDPDDEGQLLVDEVLEYAACSLPVKRLLINDNNISVVKRSLANASMPSTALTSLGRVTITFPGTTFMHPRPDWSLHPTKTCVSIPATAPTGRKARLAVGIAPACAIPPVVAAPSWGMSLISVYATNSMPM